MKKHLFQILTASLIIMFIAAMQACNRPDNSAATAVVDTTSCAYDSYLYPLYVPSGPGTKFNDLVNRVYHKENNGKNMNIIFQFFHKESGKLTLSVYAGKRDRSQFDEANEFKLRIYDSCPKVLMTKLAFYLADLELDNLDQAIDSLRKYAADSTIKFIVFMPAIKLIPNTTVTEGITKYAIYYNIYPVTDMSKIKICDDKFGLTGTGLSTNPSPPHGGN